MARSLKLNCGYLIFCILILCTVLLLQHKWVTLRLVVILKLAFLNWFSCGCFQGSDCQRCWAGAAICTVSQVASTLAYIEAGSLTPTYTLVWPGSIPPSLQLTPLFPTLLPWILMLALHIHGYLCRFVLLEYDHELERLAQVLLFSRMNLQRVLFKPGYY